MLKRILIFLQNVLGKTNEISFDVVGLYSNIPHGHHLEGIQYWLDLDEFPESLYPRFSKEFVLESAKFILENNNLNFDNEYFNQLKGVAMGAILSSTYANLTKGLFKLTFYDLYRDEYGEVLGKTRAVFSMTVKPY